MKFKLLLILLLPILVFGQTFNNGVNVLAPRPLDLRENAYINGADVPYVSLSSALISSDTNYRFIGGKRLVMSNGVQRWFTFNGGKRDSDLLEDNPLNSSANFGSFTKAQRKYGNTYFDIVDQYTGENFTATKATMLGDSTIITDAIVNGVTVFKKSDGYYVRNGNVNVLNFGADPTGVRNSSPAFIAAVNSLPIGKMGYGAFVGGDNNLGNKQGGGVVLIPPGEYRLNDPIPLKTQTTLKGAGINSTFLLSYYNDGALFTNLHATNIFASQYINIENLTIDGRATTGNGAGVHFIDNVFSSISNVTFLGFSKSALVGEGCLYTNINNCNFRYNKGYGARLVADQYGLPSNGSYIDECFFEANKIGIELVGGGNGIHKTSVQASTDTGIIIGYTVDLNAPVPAAGWIPAAGTTIDNCYFEYHKNGYDIVVLQNTLNTVISNSLFVASYETKARRMGYNSGTGTVVQNCSTQTQNIIRTDGSLQIFDQSVLYGHLKIVGGNWGNQLKATQIVALSDTVGNTVSNGGAYPYRVSVELTNDHNFHTDQTLFPAVSSIRADAGYESVYFNEPNARWRTSGTDGIGVRTSEFFSNNGGIVAKYGLQLKDDNKTMGTILDGSFGVDSAESLSNAPPGAVLKLGSKSLWIFGGNLWISSHSPASSTDGHLVNAFDGASKKRDQINVTSAGQNNFTLSFAPASIIEMYKNGVLVDMNSYSSSSTTTAMYYAPTDLVLGDKLSFIYFK